MKSSRPKIQYPKLLTGQVATLERPSCGKNVGLPQLQPDGRVAPARVQKGVFQLTRLAPVKSRSKYDPVEEDKKHKIQP